MLTISVAISDFLKFSRRCIFLMLDVDWGIEQECFIAEGLLKDCWRIAEGLLKDLWMGALILDVEICGLRGWFEFGYVSVDIEIDWVAEDCWLPVPGFFCWRDHQVDYSEIKVWRKKKCQWSTVWSMKQQLSNDRIQYWIINQWYSLQNNS